MMEIVELTDDSDAGQRHFQVERPGQVEDSCPGRAARRSHTSAPPGPEAAAVALGSAAQGAVERVTVRVSQAGQYETGQTLITAGRCRIGLDRDEDAVVDAEADPVCHTRRQLHVGGPVSRHKRSTVRSVSTLVRASTPARQSSRSVHSCGEWETPVGLRT